MKFAEVSIPLTEFKLDVVVGGTKEEYVSFQRKRYGFNEEQLSDTNLNEAHTAYTDMSSDLKGDDPYISTKVFLASLRSHLEILFQYCNKHH